MARARHRAMTRAGAALFMPDKIISSQIMMRAGGDGENGGRWQERRMMERALFGC